MHLRLRGTVASRGRPPLPLGTWGEIWVTRAGSGWRARTRFRDVDGRTRLVSKTAKTKGAARNALVESLTRRVAPIADAEITSETPLADVVNRYYDMRVEQGKWAANTRNRYRGILDDHIIPRIGGLQAQEVTVGRVDTFLQAIAKEVGAPTAKICRSVLSGAMKLAVRHGAIGTNPIRDTEGIEVSTKNPEILELEGIARLRRIAAEYDQSTGRSRRMPCNAAIVDYLLGTGARIGEAFAVHEKTDLNLEEGWTEINGTVVRDGKLIVQDHTKGGESRRLYLPRFTIDTLREYLAQLPPNTLGLLFPSANGTIRDPNNYRRVWRKMVADAGLPPGTTPHTLRRTVATLIDREANLKAAANQLGNTEGVAKKHYVRAEINTSDVADLLQQLASSGLKVV